MKLSALALMVACAIPTAQADRIYQWIDERGVTNFGSKPPDGGEAALLGESQPTTVSNGRERSARDINLRAARIYSNTKAHRQAQSHGYSSQPSGLDYQRLKDIDREIWMHSSSSNARTGRNNQLIRDLQAQRSALYGKYGVYAPVTDYGIDIR